MLKDATYKEKCVMLKSWMPQIIETIKKDLKNEHLKNDMKFMKKYFTGKNINKLVAEDLVHAYSIALEQEENAEGIAEFLTNRWLLKNTELYNYFENALSKISSDFTQITEIDKDRSREIIEGSITHFGAPRTYLFAVMNSVVFPKEIYEDLDQLAKESLKKMEQDEATHQKQLAHESLVQHHEEQMARLKDKYEKKLLGMERKYIQDMEALRKQIAALQKRLNG
jgi:hypothetical protein